MAVIKCAIQLNIPDTVDLKTPITLSQLCTTLKCDPCFLYRIMRFLTHRNIFKQIRIPSSEESDPLYAYAHTPLSRLLMKQGEQSMAALLLLESSPVMLAPWQNLSERVVAEGRASFEKAHGKDVWSYAEENAEHSQLINEAMACDARRTVRVMLEECKEAFEGVTSVVDVGGGNGTAMTLLRKACPWITCINFDTPHVIAAAPNSSHAIQHVPGDMFLAVPKADAAFLMWVLHDWGDEECIQILKTCKEAIPHKNGRVIIAEAVIEEEGFKDKLKDVGLMLDMVMMAHTNIGKERTLKEWEYLITQAGFSTFTLKNINSLKSIIIAFP
ncbi:acetylserotonin O-methyltransferase-like [Senna tora]|uniref:Acetylserotonin O-methyltransferase-like n=1 Tax=Senna tora TaxID=362788 RepID=A0A834X3K2_9FABA|nr:acetylserotonin O-methyltransferase-like [Senna tora]